MKRCFLILSVIFAIFSNCSHKTVYTSDKRELNFMIHNEAENKSFYSDSLSGTLNAFAFSIYKSIDAGTKNIFISPYSISSALALAYFGAKEKTALQFKNILGWDQDISAFGKKFSQLNTKLTTDSSKKINLFSVANSLWLEESMSFSDEYLNNTRNYLKTEVKKLDFKNETENCRETINSWVEDKTNKKIQDFIPEGILKPDTRLILTNAVYYFAKWKKEFDRKKTANSDFYITPSRKINTSFMNDFEGSYRYFEDNNIKAIEIPYKNDKYSAVFILPIETGDFLKAWDYIDIDSFQNIIRSMHNMRVDVSIPKFKISSFFRLKEVFLKLGLTELFSPNADFSGMTGGKNLYLDEAIHKTFVEVNEEGTEAAAATGIFMRETAISPEYIKKFVANHPFIFIIKENQTQTVLFIGQVFNPAQQ